MSDSPKDFAIIAVIESTFGAAEQRCTAPRIAVLVGSACEWIEAIIARASRLVVGDGRGTKVDLFWHKSKMLCERVRAWNWTAASTLALRVLKEIG
ncbi:hypothetical protein MGN70_000166 [Eutypa lata]|nr:hypothetical protein MGN70_000166 [Eutypa lata]